MLLTDLRELKAILDIPPDNTNEDKKLNFLVEQASSWICEALGRPNLDYKERTEHYNGSGTPELLLRSRPVYSTPTIVCYVDPSGLYGQTSDGFQSSTQLTYGDDFVLKEDQDDGKSRSGILVRRNRFWEKPTVRQAGYLFPYIGRDYGSVKVTYTGGYTVDDLPAQVRLALNLLVGKLRYLLPAAMELGSESYEERGVSFRPDQKSYLMGLVLPMLWPLRSWKFS